MSDSLNRTFQELKSKNDDVRVKAAHDVYAAVVVAARGEYIIQSSNWLANVVQNYQLKRSKSFTTV